MDYTLNQLRIFLKVVENQSVTKASEELHLTQPAVSIQLRNFQDQFDIPLTEVVGRRIYITDFGYEIAKAAKIIYEEVQAISQKTLAYKGKLFGSLKISIVSTGKYVMPSFLSDFIAVNEGVELSMDVTNKEKVLSSLVNNEVDFSLISLMPEKWNLEKLDLLPNKLFFVGGKEIEPKKNNKLEDVVKRSPFIFRERGSGTRQMIELFFSKRKNIIENNIELESNEAVKQAVMAGLGCSIVPLIGIKNELATKEINILPMKGLPMKSNWQLVWNKGKRHSPVAQAYLDYLRANKDGIVERKFAWCNDY